MRSAPLLAAFLAFSTLSTLSVRGAGLDLIDVAGVTERGGGPKYARMLPRTGTNGLLSATLLPPLADWASVPIANLYYASAGAPSEGNGAPQYPFKTLEYALGQMASATNALVMAPGTYSGTATMQPGRSVALLGSGWGTRISALTVTAQGSSDDTALELADLRVGTLTVNGGKVKIRLARAQVDRLEGSASPVTVVRLDMGALIGSSSSPYTDVYMGYDTAPRALKALALAESGSTYLLELSAGRPEVVDGQSRRPLAFMEDVTDATSAVYTVMERLEGADTSISNAVVAEQTAREGADTALSNNLTAVIGVLRTDFRNLGSGWNGHVQALTTRMNGISAGVNSLDAREQRHYSELVAATNELHDGYVSADTALRSTLSNSITNSVTALSNNMSRIVQAMAGSAAADAIGAVSNSIIARAVSTADMNAIGRETVLSNRIALLQSSSANLPDRVTAIENNWPYLVAATNNLQSAVANLGNQINNLNVGALRTAVTAHGAWQQSMTSWSNNVDTTLARLQSAINGIIDSLAAITNKASLTGVSIPSKL